MANTGWGLNGIWKVFSLKPQGHVDQGNQNGNFHEWSDDRSESLPRIDSKDRHGHCNRKLEVVRCSREAQCCGLLVGGANFHRKKEGNKEHNDEVNAERDSYPNYIEGQLNDILSFEGKHDQDGKKQGNESDGANPR